LVVAGRNGPIPFAKGGAVTSALKTAEIEMAPLHIINAYILEISITSVNWPAGLKLQQSEPLSQRVS